MRAQLRFMLTLSCLLSAFSLPACQGDFDESESDETDSDVDTASSPIDAADPSVAGDPTDELDPTLGDPTTLEKPKGPKDTRTPAQKECQALCVAAELGCFLQQLSNHQDTKSCEIEYNACIAACGQTDVVK